MKKGVSWLVWSVSALDVPYQFMLQSSTSVMIPLLMAAFEINKTGLGFLTSSFFYTYLFFQIPAGILVDRYGARLALACSTALCGLACALFAWADSLTTAEAARLLMGMATAPAVPATLSVAAKWFSPQRFAMVAGMSEMIGMFGGATGEAYLARGVEAWGWRHTMLLCAILGIVLSVLMGWIVRNRPTKEKILSEKRIHPFTVIQEFRRVLQEPQAWWNGLVAGFSFASLPAFAGLWAVPYLQNRYGFSLNTAGLLSGLIFAGTACGCPFWGFMTDKIGKRKPLIYLSNALSFSMMLWILYGPTFSAGIIGVEFVLLGFISAVYVVPFAIMRDISQPAVRGMAMGFVNMMSMIIGAPLLQPLIGYLLKWNYSVALSVLPLCLGLSLLATLRIRETHCREQYPMVQEKEVINEYPNLVESV